MDREQAREKYLRRAKRKRMGRGIEGPMTAGPRPQRRMSLSQMGRLNERQRRQQAMQVRPGMLTGGQIKIAKKAPPFDKINEKDFAVLRKEKAKGRGKGLQDEKMKPGKIMKADKGGMGEATKYKKYLKGLKDVRMKNLGSKFLERRAKLAGTTVKGIERAAKATRIGKIAAGVAALGLAGKAALEKMYEKRTGKKPFTKRPDKKMGGGMMMQRPMGFDKGGVGMFPAVKSPTDKMKPTAKTFKKRRKTLSPSGKMGGGMMMRPNPVGYSKGVMVKTKIGRNKPTKMY